VAEHRSNKGKYSEVDSSKRGRERLHNKKESKDMDEFVMRTFYRGACLICFTVAFGVFFLNVRRTSMLNLYRNYVSQNLAGAIAYSALLASVLYRMCTRVSSMLRWASSGLPSNVSSAHSPLFHLKLASCSQRTCTPFSTFSTNAFSSLCRSWKITPSVAKNHVYYVTLDMTLDGCLEPD